MREVFKNTKTKLRSSMTESFRLMTIENDILDKLEINDIINE